MLVGFPYKEYLFAKEDKEVWLNEHNIPEFLALGYKPLNHTRMGYAAPQWIVGKKEGGILLLDDSKRANLNILQAAMDILDRQEYISWKLPKGWTVVTTNNPDDGHYLVTSTDNAHKTRQINVEVKFDAAIWAEWAEGNGVDGRCINFLLKHPELIENCKDGSLNARIFTKFFYSLKTVGDFEQNLTRVQILAEGSIGTDAACMFTQFIHNKLDKLPTPKQMIEDAEDKMLNSLRKLTKAGTSDARADIAHILSTRLMNYCVTFAENNTVSDAMQARVAAILEDEKIFTVDIRQLVLRKLGTHPKYKKILTNKLIKYFLN